MRIANIKARLLAPLIITGLAGCVADPAVDENSPDTGENVSSSASMSSVVSSPASEAASSSAASVSSAPTAPPQTGWKLCANGQETCQFEGVSQVRWGAEDSWIVKDGVTGQIACTNQAFGGDPLRGTFKRCEVPVGTTVVTGTASSTSSSSASPAPEEPTRDLAKLFNDKGCNACHANGALISDINALVDNNSLIAKIGTMPPANPGVCVGQCAEDIAEYLTGLYYIAPAANIRKANVPTQSAIRKAKMLIEGSAVTDAELRSFKQDKDNIRGMIQQWQQKPGYQEKMRWFLEENLQFARSIGQGAYTGQLRGNSAANPPTKYINPKIYENGHESAIRTIMQLIVNADKPFTNIATQTEWMLTPALMSLLLAFDYPNKASELDFKIGVDLTDAEKRYSMARKIETRRFYFPPPPGADAFTTHGGNKTRLVNRKEIAFVWGALNQFSDQTRDRSHQVFKDSDYTTWKKVKIVKASSANPRQKFWDLPTLRNTNTLYLESERVGFFTHPNFFNRWETNDDNQWRVTINQALITALNKSFAPDDLSISLNDELLSADHAAPGTDCYACHRLVDPMRNYFRNLYDDEFGKPRDAAARREMRETASFSFVGETETGENLIDLGRALASHPAFAPGWVQKLCYYSNSQACIESDEEFIRVAEAFRDSNHNFNQLILEFFSSDLFLKDVEEKSDKAQPAFASITRQQHICQKLSRRMTDFSGSRQRPCDSARNAVSVLAENIPADDWTRGALAPAMPTRLEMFNYTTVENMCQNIALNSYNTAAFPVKAIGAFLDDYYLPHILGIPDSDSRRGAIRGVLVDHYRSAKAKPNVDEKAALVSVFTLGCVSPLISSVDF